jgi:peptidoglycan/xylan/chitin deacetylase (PgdA/CDA1 family)
MWPDNRPFVLGLSHDVDRILNLWWFISFLRRIPDHKCLNSLYLNFKVLLSMLHGDNTYWNFPRIFKLEDALGVRSTFFFLHEQGKVDILSPKSSVIFGARYQLNKPAIASIITSLDSNRWEIGLHGSYNSSNFLELLSYEKDMLETILGHRVLGIRQHYLRLDIPKTWEIHANLGFHYDSSLGFTDRVGFRWKAFLPFYPVHPLTGKKIPVLQIPLAIMDGPLMRYEDPWAEVTKLIGQVEAVNGVLTLNFHQRVFNPWEPENYQDMYIRIIKECQKRGAWVATLGEVAEWWESHHVQ